MPSHQNWNGEDMLWKWIMHFNTQSHIITQPVEVEYNRLETSPTSPPEGDPPSTKKE